MFQEKWNKSVGVWETRNRGWRWEEHEGVGVFDNLRQSQLMKELSGEGQSFDKILNIEKIAEIRGFEKYT